MKKRPSLVLRDPVKLYENTPAPSEKELSRGSKEKSEKADSEKQESEKRKSEEVSALAVEQIEMPSAPAEERINSEQAAAQKSNILAQKSEIRSAPVFDPGSGGGGIRRADYNEISIKNRMSPRVGQIWDYFCRKAWTEGNPAKSFNATRAEVMKESRVGSSNTYRDALKKFQESGLLEIELRPGVNSGSIFTFTEKGIEEILAAKIAVS